MYFMFVWENHYLVHKVDASGGTGDPVVQLGAGLAEVGNVGNMTAHFPIAVIQLSNVQRVVQIACRRRVDREHSFRSEVAAVFEF
jgi:hypothetical protein